MNISASPPRLAAIVAALAIAGFASDAVSRQVHGTTRTSVGGASANRSANVNSSANRSADVNRSASVNSNVNVNSNTNVNRNVNVNSNVNVNRNIDVDVDNHWDDNYHPVARAAAVTTAVAVTAAAIGSIAYSVPPSCVPVVVNGATYQQCGSTWYQPQYAGASVQYVVVSAPR